MGTEGNLVRRELLGKIFLCVEREIHADKPFSSFLPLKMTMKRHDAWSSGSHFAIVRVTKTIAEILPQNPDIVLPFI